MRPPASGPRKALMAAAAATLVAVGVVFMLRGDSADGALPPGPAPPGFSQDVQRAVASGGLPLDLSAVQNIKESNGLTFIIAPGLGRAASTDTICFAVLKATQSAATVTCGAPDEMAKKGNVVLAENPDGSTVIQGMLPDSFGTALRANGTGTFVDRFFSVRLPKGLSTLSIETSSSQTWTLPLPARSGFGEDPQAG
jgi:hypothetical protein